jgi:hypothetical protein
MKRVTQLFIILLALTTVNLAAESKKGGGSRSQNKAGGYGYYCYSDGLEMDCGNMTSCNCRGECDRVCGGVCDWDGSCIIT